MWHHHFSSLFGHLEVNLEVLIIPKSVWCELVKLIHTLFLPSFLKKNLCFWGSFYSFEYSNVVLAFLFRAVLGVKEYCELPSTFIKKSPKMLSIELPNFVLMLWGFLPSTIFTIIAILNWCSLFIVSFGRFSLIYKIKDNIWYCNQNKHL